MHGWHHWSNALASCQGIARKILENNSKTEKAIEILTVLSPEAEFSQPHTVHDAGVHWLQLIWVKWREKEGSKAAGDWDTETGGCSCSLLEMLHWDAAVMEGSCRTLRQGSWDPASPAAAITRHALLSNACKSIINASLWQDSHNLSS